MKEHTKFLNRSAQQQWGTKRFLEKKINYESETKTITQN